MRPCTVMDKLTNGLRAPIFPRAGELFFNQISPSISPSALAANGPT
jgi:hypothetical protein